jgi:hypothetical protein
MGRCVTCGGVGPLDALLPEDLCRCPAPSEANARRVVVERSGDRCELCGRRGANFAHRLGAGQGGLWLPSNGWRACGSGTTGCHGWATREPFLAERGGWRIDSTGEHPASVPIWLQPWLGPGWYLLNDDGSYTRLWERTDTPTLPTWVRPGAALGSLP